MVVLYTSACLGCPQSLMWPLNSSHRPSNSVDGLFVLALPPAPNVCRLGPDVPLTPWWLPLVLAVLESFILLCYQDQDKLLIMLELTTIPHCRNSLSLVNQIINNLWSTCLQLELAGCVHPAAAAGVPCGTSVKIWSNPTEWSMLQVRHSFCVSLEITVLGLHL